MRPTAPESQRRVFEPVIGRLLAESRQRFGFQATRLEPVGFEERPFSWLCRAAVFGDAQGEPALHVFLKIFKPKDPAAGVDLQARVRQDFDTTRDIYAFMCESSDLGVVKPIAYYEDVLAIVTVQADGVTLLDDLQARATWFPSSAVVAELEASLATVGRWLKRFQGFRPGSGHLTAQGLCDYVDVRLRRLTEHAVLSADDRQRILGHLAGLGRQLTPADLAEVSVHADLAPANILVSGRRVVLLDFAMAGRGTALHDISRLYMQLDLLHAKPQFRRAVIDRLNAALLHGFDPTLTARAPLFRLLSMLHHVNHLGTLALKRERFPASLLSARAVAMHRRWIARELSAGSEAA